MREMVSSRRFTRHQTGGPGVQAWDGFAYNAEPSLNTRREKITTENVGDA